MSEIDQHTMNVNGNKFNITDLYMKLDPVKDVKIDFSNIQEEFLRQSELVAAYGYLCSVAESQEKQVEYQLERVYAVLDHQTRSDFEASGVKSTETKIRNTIITNPEYQELKLDLIEARKQKQLFKATCNALNHKLQALINAGADQRKTTVEPRVFEQ